MIISDDIQSVNNKFFGGDHPMSNQDIRRTAAGAGVKLWQIADALGIADCSFSRKLRKELHTGTIPGGELMADKLEPLAVRPSEAARLVDVSRTTFYRWMHRADFPVIRLGGCTRIPVDGLREWIAKQSEVSTV